MKAIVCSDSHGDLDAMIAAVEREAPDLVFHLGDHWEDGRALKQIYPEQTLKQVPGNCDWQPGEPLELTLTLEGCRIALCHGHTRGVKRSYRELIRWGQDVEANLVLCGHTHRVHYERCGGLHVLNPGAAGREEPTYAVLYLERGKLEGKIKRGFSEEVIICFC